MAKKTRILITHALHVLDKVDYVYVMDEGKIVEQGTFAVCPEFTFTSFSQLLTLLIQVLRCSGPIFSKLIEEYGAQACNEDAEDIIQTRTMVESRNVNVGSIDKPTQPKVQATLMQAEERETGGITWQTYHEYLRYGGRLVIIFPFAYTR
jgi:ATP-binding cassette, subfamily C (CFTR/MRP), member 1